APPVPVAPPEPPRPVEPPLPAPPPPPPAPEALLPPLDPPVPPSVLLLPLEQASDRTIIPVSTRWFMASASQSAPHILRCHPGPPVGAAEAGAIGLRTLAPSSRQSQTSAASIDSRRRRR